MTDLIVVDDHDLIAEAVRLSLVGDGIDASVMIPCPLPDLLAHLLGERPALVLLDLDLGAFGSGVGLIAPLVEAGIRVLVVSGTPDPLHIAVALEQGAIGYHPKSQGLGPLLARAHAALVADRPLDTEERRRLLSELARSRGEKERVFGPFRLLTDREQDTLRALGAGSSVHQIADEWIVSEATVRSHVRGVLTKLNATSQLAAVASALRSGWLAEQDGAVRTK